MHRLVVDVEDKYINLVVDLLSNLKQDIVKNMTIQKEEKRSVSKLDTFRRLRDKSNNKTKLTMEMATDTSEMVNDGISWYQCINLCVYWEYRWWESNISHKLNEDKNDLDDNLEFLSTFLQASNFTINKRILEILKETSLYISSFDVYHLAFAEYYNSKSNRPCRLTLQRS